MSALRPVGASEPLATGRGRVLRVATMRGEIDVVLGAGDDRHVRACLDGSVSAKWLACSDVLYQARQLVHPLEAVDALCMYPGAAVCSGATHEHGYVVAVREREKISVLSGCVRSVPSSLQCADLGSAVHAWLAAGRRLDTLKSVRGEDGQIVVLARLDVTGGRQARRMSLL